MEQEIITRFAPSPTGELHIGGVSLARGYYNNNELTIRKFIPNPFISESSARLYKTGDIVKYRADGQLEYVERQDHQVKVRGFRIELGEIEGALNQQEVVLESAVTVREDIPGQQTIVAYLVPKPGELLDSKTIKRALASQLPDYMIPTWMVTLSSLPLTPNGKLDRKSLPKPVGEMQSDTPNYMAPKSTLENRIVEIFEIALHVKPISNQDNFFDLGANSLLLIQISDQLSKSLGREVNVMALMQYPSIQELAAHLESSNQPKAAGAKTAQGGSMQDRAAKQRQARMQMGKKRRNEGEGKSSTGT